MKAPVAAPQTEGSEERTDMSDSAKPKSVATGFTIRILYLFAGAERKTSVVEYLRSLAAKKGW